VNVLDGRRPNSKLRPEAAQGRTLADQLATNPWSESQIRTLDPLIKSRDQELPTDTHNDVFRQDTSATP
jgi:hypothetical protein